MNALLAIFPENWTRTPFGGGYLAPPDVNLGIGEWVFVSLATFIIFVILGPRLWQDLVKR